MDYRGDDSTSVGLMDSDSALFESDDIRLRTKSLEVTDTRQGHSALVPGLSTVTTPGEDVAKVKPFTFYKPSHNVESEVKNNTTTETIKAGDVLPVQEVTRPHTSVRVYPSQSENSRHVGGSETELEPLLKEKKKLKSGILLLKRWKLIVLVVLIAVVLIISCSIVLIRISTVPGTISQIIEVENQDMVMLNYFDTFYYNEITIEKSKDNRCPTCTVEVYSFYPDNLIVDDNYFNVSSGDVTATHDDVILSPKYFISGSKVKLTAVFFPTKTQNTTIKFVLYNNLQQYEAFQRGDKPDAYQTYRIQVNEKEKTYSLSLTIVNTGYYFIGVRPDSPVSLQFTVIVHQIYYSRDNFPPPVCVLTSTASCTVPFTPSSTDAYTDTLNTCVLVYSIPPHEVAESYYVTLEYNVYRGFWNMYAIALLSLVCLSALCVPFLCFYCACSCVCSVLKARNKKNYNYLTIN